MHRSTPLHPIARRFCLLIIGLAVIVGCTPAPAPAWSAKTPPLSTRWTSQVDPATVLPEYPRPQMVRDEWLNLNGVWEFAPAVEGQAPPVDQRLADRVLVPFPIESALSGLQAHHERMWYRRAFAVPEAWLGCRIQLNFGAVDWEATVFINGQPVGTHRGGYDAFSFDITDALRDGSNEVLVAVYDPTDGGGQPIGKQRTDPEGIFYTSSSGIWQTVWLEPTPATSIARLDMTPDLDGEALRLVVHSSATAGATVQVQALDGGTGVGTASGPPNAEIRVPVPNPKLWSPDDPFLYDLRVELTDGTSGGDVVTSYFGMRSIRVEKVGRVLRPVLNGSFVFQMGTLDQGYWPDGLYTAPTDEALRFDLQQHKYLGYNLVRKHDKVEPQRWYYWADKLGLLVWQDMPSMKLENPTPAARQQFEVELRELVNEHRSAPSIVMWIPFNEGWGAYEPRRVADLVKQWDASRLVSSNSGVNCCGNVDGGNGDVVDWHVYVGPEIGLPSVLRSSVLGEFGGLGLAVPGHTWRPGDQFSYKDERDPAALTAHYETLITKVEKLMTGLGLSAAVYTQLTDVETEVNGLLTYDRAVLKPDAAAITAVNQHVIDASKTLTP